eukprot:m.50813 g.50813  ORF g.50813 m.50813 type:complete len:160 (-) comp10912_c0_seq2:206-685(-)
MAEKVTSKAVDFVKEAVEEFVEEERSDDNSNNERSSHGQQPFPINLIRNFGPLSANFSLGTVAGVCASIAIKKLSRKAAFVVGGGYLALQLLSYNGYITVNWNKIEHDVVSVFDTDGDGKILEGDVNYWQEQVQGMLKYEVPTSLAGFGSGLALGWKYL